MAEFAPLFPLETQFQAKDGRNNTAGWLKVFLAGTDDPAVTYSDYSGTRNPEKIVLDNNGRAVIICDKEVGYRLEVYDARGMLLWTEEPVFCSGTGGAGMAITEIVSTDGSIDVQKNTAGGITQYDIGLAPGDSPEFLEWSTGFRGNMTYGSAKVPNYSAGTMSFDQYGVMVYKDRYYHITNKFYIKPLGTGTNYETFEVALMLRNPADGSATSVEIRKWDIDTSLTDEVQVEMSFDLTPSQDGELYWEFYNSLPKFQSTDAWIQIHRVYSGINAVPDTCATKQWVSSNYIHQSASGNFQTKSGMSAYVPYSAIEGDSGTISGINGSAISGMVDPSQFMPASASSDLVAYSALEYDGSGQVTGISGSAIGGQVDTADFLPASASGDFYPMTGNPSGFLTAHQDISNKLDSSAFTAYTSTALTGIQNDITSISASVSAVTGLTGTYLEQSSFTSYSADLDSALDSAFSAVQDEMGNKADGSALTAYIPFSSLDYSGSAISGIGGSALAGIGQGGDYSGIYPVLVDNVNRTISVDDTGIAVDETMTAYESGGELVIGVASATLAGKLDTSAFTGYTATALTGLEQDVSSLSATVSGLTGTYLEQSASALFAPSSVETSKLDASASSQFITSTAGLQPSGDYAYNSALSGKLDESAFSSVSGTFLTAVPAGYATETYVNSAVSGKVDLSSNNTIQISANGLTISGGSGITARFSNNMAVLQTYPTHRMYLSDLGASKRVDIYMSGISGNGDGTWQYGTSEYNKLTSVYDTVSGNSASWVGGGGIDSATCSAIASSYAESAASGKLDESAFSSVSGTFLTSVSLPITGAEGVETAVYGIHSLEIRRNETEGEPDIRSAYLNPESLTIQSTYDGIDTTAVTVSEYGIYFNEPGRLGTVDIDSISSWNAVYDTVSANSASWSASGVDSATVSAIASSYQVVSATGTQTYAGTAYVTSLNSAPVSAERAGNAANAALANSAWYDGTGRFISALPDSAAVSAIASAYAESAASGKQDTLSFGYDSNNAISSIDGSALAGGGGGIEYSGVSPIVVDNDEHKISAQTKPLAVDDTMTSYESGGYTVLGVQTSAMFPASASSMLQPSGDYAYNSSLSSYQPTSSMTSYMFASAIQAVADSSMATANGVLYILTGGV